MKTRQRDHGVAEASQPEYENGFHGLASLRALISHIPKAKTRL
jgi:hypothetical protein